MLTIEAEGHVWPLDTFIDSHRFRRSDGDVPPIARSDWPLACITADCRIIEEPARHVPWHTIIAYRAPELSSHLAQCPDCGDTAEIASSLFANEDGTLILDCPTCGSADPDGYC
ncbi:hypothetical protein [Croceicoccus sp. YJ47]|uniref:hypothetical protein n=1 Tax=Croceicoccus sp. YJ47 TaxID=2798724 RepID=UPI001920C81C|nr:hypothetical protein [Croceicoccus sp. YJ47]QQN73142.1 hypothetical protein JD971_09695 [Croceicoccus sp. YJ47]